MEDHLSWVEQAQRDKFMQYSNIRLLGCQQGRALTQLTVDKTSLNPYGFVHGGALYTMFDCAAGAVAHSEGGLYVTMSSSLNFLHSGTEGDVIQAEAIVRRRGYATCYVDVNITNQSGTLLASGNATFFRIDV